MSRTGKPHTPDGPHSTGPSGNAEDGDEGEERPPPIGEEIAALTPTRRDPGRVSIKTLPTDEPSELGEPDGPASRPRRKKPRFWVAVAEDTVGALDLHLGRVVDAELAEAVRAAAGRDKALASAMVRIGRRDFSSGMMRDRLVRAGHPPAAADYTVEWLLERGLIDDAAFADAVIRSVRRGKPAGEKLLRVKLREKRLSNADIDAALARNREPDDAVRDQAHAFAEKEAGKMRGLDPQVLRRRLYGRLARRGFPPDVTASAVQAAVSGSDEVD